MDYVIWAPSFLHNSAGIRALYKLGDVLNAKGYETKVCPPKDAAMSDAIHIFPESINGRPRVSARGVVRWLLNKQMYPIDPADQVFVWTKGLDESKPRLALDMIEPEYFYPDEGKRSGTLIYTGKGNVRDNQVDGTFLTRYWPGTREELGEVLRGAELVVSYDPFSMLNVEATLCGTPVVILQSQVAFGVENWSRADQEATDFGAYGLAYGWDELDRAKEELPLAQDAYANYRDKIFYDVDNFIEATQEEGSWPKNARRVG